MKKNGLTILEILMVVSVAAAVCLGCAVIFRRCFAVDYSVEQVEKEARLWATGMSLPVTTVSCASHAEDGYIPCTVASSQGGKMELIAIECAAPLTPEKGCRLQRAALPGPHR